MSAAAVPTKLAYQYDTYLWKSEGTVVAVLNDDSVILDETILHPQGGGQPSDHGTISSEKATLNVKNVIIDMDTGLVKHVGEYAGSDRFHLGERVNLSVDSVRRMLMARWHSAGHIIDIALEEINPGTLPHGTSHFPGQAFVAFALQKPLGPTADLEVLRRSIEETTNRLIREELPCQIHFRQPSSLSPEDYAVLPEKARKANLVRMIEFGHCKPIRPCGGTHVAKSIEVGQVRIKKVSLKKEGTILSVSYEVI